MLTQILHLRNTQSLLANGRITSLYGDRIHPVKKVMKFHDGIDIGVPIGTLVIEKYLNDTISDRRKPLEKNMLESSTMMYMDSYKKD